MPEICVSVEGNLWLGRREGLWLGWSNCIGYLVLRAKSSLPAMAEAACLGRSCLPEDRSEARKALVAFTLPV